MLDKYERLSREFAAFLELQRRAVEALKPYFESGQMTVGEAVERARRAGDHEAVKLNAAYDAACDGWERIPWDRAIQGNA